MSQHSALELIHEEPKVQEQSLAFTQLLYQETAFSWNAISCTFIDTKYLETGKESF